MAELKTINIQEETKTKAEKCFSPLITIAKYILVRDLQFIITTNYN